MKTVVRPVKKNRMVFGRRRTEKKKKEKKKVKHVNTTVTVRGGKDRKISVAHERL